MAKKGFIKDLNNIEILPITRGELVLDSSGKLALRSNEFLATNSLPGLMSKEDKAKLDIFNTDGLNLVSATTDGLAPKIGTAAASTVTTQADEWVLTSTKGATPTWRKLPTNAFLNYYRPILVNGTSLLGNNNTALNIAAGTNINLTTDAGKVTINNGLTKLSLLTDDILSGKYLPLTGGTLTGNLTIGSKSNQAFNYLLLSRLNRGVRINNTDGNAYISFGTLTDANGLTLEKVLTFGDSGLRYSPDASTYYNILHGLNTYIQNGIITINGASITPITSHQSLSNYVTLDTNLTITGAKIFSNNSTHTLVLNGTDVYSTLQFKTPNYVRTFGINKQGNLFITPSSNWDAEYLIWHSGNDGSDSGLDADLLDGKHSNLFLNLVTDKYYYDLSIRLTEENKGNALLLPYFQRIGTDENNMTALGSARKGVLRICGGSSESLLVFDHFTGNMYFRGYDTNWTPWKTVAFTDSNITGNAATATKLQTKRKLWGLDFDGTADVSGDMTGVGIINTIFNLKTQSGNASLYLETATADTDYAHIFVSNKNDNKTHASRPLVLQNGYGNVGIGASLPTHKLTVNGDVKAISFIGNLDWSYITNKPASFTPAAHDHTRIINTDTSGRGIEGTLLPSKFEKGLTFNTIYSGLDKSWPINYGNVVTIRGNGDNLIVISWNANQTETNTNVALEMYIRSKRDSAAGDKWSDWTRVITDRNYPEYCASKSHTHASSQITALTGYAKATSASDLVTTDTLNIALGKLEYKAGIAYSWYRTITEDDTDEIINKWDEVVDFVNNLAVDISEEFVTRKTTLTITGLKTFESNSNTTGVSLILKNKGWASNMSTAMDFYNGGSYTVPNARIETKMTGNGNAGGTLIFYTQATHASTNPNPNGLYERFRLGDDGTSTLTGVLTISGSESVLTLNNDSAGNVGLTFKRGSKTAWSIIDSGGNLLIKELSSNTTRVLLYEASQGGSAFFAGSILATKFIKSGGTSSQFLKADGSVDSNKYLINTHDTHTSAYYRVTNVNGTNYAFWSHNSNAAFTIYAPSTAGTKGLVLTSNGSGAPVWTDLSNLKISSLIPTTILSSGSNKFNYVKFASINLTSRYSGMYAILKLTHHFTTSTDYGTSCDLYVHCYQLDPIGTVPRYTIKTNNDDSSFTIVGIVNYSSTSSTLDLYVHGKSWTYLSINVLKLAGDNIINIGTNIETLPSGTQVIPLKTGHVEIANSVKNALTFASGAFAAKTYNGSAAVTVNIPTKTSHLTNDSGFLTQHLSLANYVTLNTNLTISGVKTFNTSLQINSGSSITDEGGNGVLGVKSKTWTGVPSDGSAISLGTLNNSLYIRTSSNNLIHYISDLNKSFKILDEHNYSSYLGYIGTTAVQKESKEQALTGITRISNKTNANLHLGNADNSGWVYTLDIASWGGISLWSIRASGIATFANTVTAKGFVKSGSSDSYVLLGGGGHKAISDFLLKSEIANQELSANLTTITKSLTVTADWMDTGIKYTDLPANGTYVVQVSVDASDSTGSMYNCYWSGVMSWYRGSTNDNEADEILLHRSGHGRSNTIYLRTIMTTSTDGRHLQLLIAANKNIGAAYTYTFKFKRII